MSYAEFDLPPADPGDIIILELESERLIEDSYRMSNMPAWLKLGKRVIDSITSTQEDN
jgi:hypothetical protein